MGTDCCLRDGHRGAGPLCIAALLRRSACQAPLEAGDYRAGHGMTGEEVAQGLFGQVAVALRRVEAALGAKVGQGYLLRELRHVMQDDGGSMPRAVGVLVEFLSAESGMGAVSVPDFVRLGHMDCGDLRGANQGHHRRGGVQDDRSARENSDALASDLDCLTPVQDRVGEARMEREQKRAFVVHRAVRPSR